MGIDLSSQIHVSKKFFSILQPPAPNRSDYYFITPYLYYAIFIGVVLLWGTLIVRIFQYFQVPAEATLSPDEALVGITFNLALSIPLIWLLMLLKQQKFKRGLLFAIIIGLLAVSIDVIVIGQGFYDPVLTFIFVILIITSAYLGQRSLLLVSALSILIIAINYRFENSGWSIVSKNHPPPNLEDLALYVGSVTMASLFLRATMIRLQQKSNSLEEKRKELEEHQDHLEEMVLKRTKELSIAKNEADRANHTKTLFLANMSHELRTPLNAIIGYSEMILEEAELIEGKIEIEEDAKRVGQAGRHLLTLINNILDYSKYETNGIVPSYSEFCLKQVISELRTVITPLIEGSSNRFELILPESEIIMICDRVRLGQILINLISNAVKFTQNGLITLAISIPEHQPKNEEMVLFKVIDNGIGIDEEFIPHLFDPFSQADNSYTKRHQGTGLGLSITNTLCQVLGGFITVESEVGVGSTFHVWLPRNPQQPLSDTARSEREIDQPHAYSYQAPS